MAQARKNATSGKTTTTAKKASKQPYVRLDNAWDSLITSRQKDTAAAKRAAGQSKPIGATAKLVKIGAKDKTGKLSKSFNQESKGAMARGYNAGRTSALKDTAAAKRAKNK